MTIYKLPSQTEIERQSQRNQGHTLSKQYNNKQPQQKHKGHRRQRKTDINRLQRKRSLIKSSYEAKVDHAKTFIKNLSNVHLTDSEILVLSKNLKFAPTPDPPNTRDLIKDLDDLARRMRTRLWMFERNTKKKTDPFSMNNSRKIDVPSDNVALENYITATKIEIANLHYNRRHSREHMLKNAIRNIRTNKPFKRTVKSNFSPGFKAALKRLKKNPSLIVKKSDKGNCTVVINREQYVKEGMRQLNSCKHYKSIEKDLTHEFTLSVNKALKEIFDKGEINSKHFEYLSPVGKQGIKTAELYLLNKVHSDPPTKARPIISANGCPVERISEYVDFFLQPFVTEQHTYIKDTSDFIRKVEKLTVPDDALIITLDYESMYTNIIHDEAVSAIKNTLSGNNKHRYVQGIKRPSLELFCNLVELAVKCNNFRFNGKHFYQSMGVAMGHKASPAICDIVIYYLEERILKLAGENMFKWLRFRDDVFALYVGCETEAIRFLNEANEMHPTLKFKYEISHQQGIFLDTIVFKGHRFEKENVLDFKPYTKPSEKFQYIHRHSAHPNAVFRGLIKGELIRFIRTSTNKDDFLKRAALFKEKLLLRGYTSREFEQIFKQVDRNLRKTYLIEKTDTKGKCTPLVFTTKYNPHLKGYHAVLTRNWKYIEESDILRKVFPQKPILAFRRNKNLQDTLVRARLKPLDDTDYLTQTDELDKLISLLEKDPDAGLCSSTPTGCNNN